jgi:hypothetical protein
VAAFVVLSVGMAAAVDIVRPQWRDPEFAVRVARLREWKAKAPYRPLVVAFGSSRTQMGLSPGVMNFPDEPGSPLIYNCGYRGSPPLGIYLHFTRVLDAGIKPDAVLIQLAPLELRIPGDAERQLALWGVRLSAGDARRLAPYTEDTSCWPVVWGKAHLLAWCNYRQAVLSDLLEDWQTPVQRITYIWNLMDEYGFWPHFLHSVTDDQRHEFLEQSKLMHGEVLDTFTATEPMAWQACAGVVHRCREEGIAVAFFWAPESPTYRSWHSAAFREGSEEFATRLTAELGVPVFPAPTHLEETDFVDGYHLIKTGAEKYSRWLADTHLKPWLKSQGLAK